MTRSYALVEVLYAFWAVLAVPIGFAGLFYVFPGLDFAYGVPLLAIAGLLLLYVSALTRYSRPAWLLGVAAHALLLIAAIYYVPRWPALLAWPLALANLYSVVVLLAHRRLWTAGGDGLAGPAAV